MDAVSKVQKEFIAEVEKRGIVHALEWISGWYSKVAMAQVVDEFNGCNDTVIASDSLVQLIQQSTSSTNKSSSAGANMMREARMQALAQLVSKSPLRGELQRRRDAAVEQQTASHS